MSFRHIWAVTRKEFNHIYRDKSTLFLVLFTPTLILLLMAYALTVDLKHIPIAVLDLDRSQTSQKFIQQITAGQDLDLYTISNKMSEIDSMMMNGEIKAAVIIAPNFSADLIALKGLSIQVIIDGTEPQGGNFAVQHITQRAEQFIDTALSNQLSAQGFVLDTLQPLDVRVQTWFNPDLKDRNALIPGLLSMVLGFPALSVALTLAQNANTEH